MAGMRRCNTARRADGGSDNTLHALEQRFKGCLPQSLGVSHVPEPHRLWLARKTLQSESKMV